MEIGFTFEFGNKALSKIELEGCLANKNCLEKQHPTVAPT